MGTVVSKKAGESSPSPQVQANGSTATMADNTASSSAVASANTMLYMAELSSYEAACRLEPEVQSFDAILKQRTSHVISTLAVDIQLRSLSISSLNEVTSCLVDMNQEVIKVILECKKDVWKNPKLFELVEEYFQNSLQTLDFFSALDECLRNARHSQLIVHVAIRRFEEGVGEGEKGRYIRVLEELRNFKAAGDPFTEEFFRMFHAVYKQQVAMLEKLQLRKRELDEKLKSGKTWRKISIIIFAATLSAVFIFSVVAAAVAAPPVVTALATAASGFLSTVGPWLHSFWKKYEEAVKGQRGLIAAMHVGSYIAIKDLDSIRVLVDQLETQIDHLLQTADFATRDEDALKLGVEEIKKRLEIFMKSIEDLTEQADRCSRDIRKARTVVLQRIIKHPN